MLKEITRHARQGLTIIELMIVVSVLAILGAIVLPRFANAREQAQTAEAAVSMNQIIKAIMRYRTEHNMWPADQSPGIFPAELEPYLVAFDFNQAPLGGRWDYEDWRGTGQQTSSGTPIGVALSLRGGDSELYDEVDQLIDDGDLSTGALQYAAAWGGCIVYLIAPE